METLTIEQVHSFIFIFFMLFFPPTTFISSFVSLNGCKNENNIECLVLNLIFMFQIFVSIYMPLNESKITKDLTIYINKGIFSSDVFIFILIDLIEVLSFFSIILLAFVFDKNKK